MGSARQHTFTGGRGSTMTISTITPASLGGVPAFSAYLNVDQTISNNTRTKIQFGVKNFDTNSCYDNTTNYRFTPTVAGYYQINATIQMQNSASGNVVGLIYKNGSLYFNLFLYTNNAANNTTTSGSNLVYCNGTTDYLEIYCSQTSGGNLSLYGLASNGGYNSFSASMVRAA